MSESFYTSVEKYGRSILFRGYEDGVPVKRKIKFKPTLYVPTDKKNPGYQTLFGTPLEPYRPGDMKECAQFVKEHEDLSNFDIYGNTDYVAQFICHYFSDARPDKDLVNRLTFDMEVDSSNGFPDPDKAEEMITAISAKSSLDDVYHVWTVADYDPDETILRDIEIKYHDCHDEEEIIRGFLDFWTHRYPDIITGWNIEYFDVPYLYNRINKLFGTSLANSISPWGIVFAKEVYHSGKNQVIYNIKGIQNLDYIKAFKKFGYNYPQQESYKLDHIAHTVLGERKVNHEEYSGLHDLFNKNPQLFTDYAIKDTWLVDRIDEKEDLINLIVILAYKGGVNFEDAFGSVKIWDTYIYKELLSKNIIIPPNEFHDKVGSIEGGHVKSPHVGMHEYIASFDLNSLYPHIIMQYNMSPETIDSYVSGVTVDGLLEGRSYSFDRDEFCMAASGQLFRKNKKGVLPIIVEELYDERKVYKSKMNDDKKKLEDVDDPYERNELEKEIAKSGNMQMAVKILMNSLFGAMSNKYFRYFDDRIAESITKCGQLASRWAERDINLYLNGVLKTGDYDYVIAIDTDSLYLRLENAVRAVFGDNLPSMTSRITFLDNLCEKKLVPEISRSYEKMREYLACTEQKMEMKREVIADKGIWTKKKRYVLNVYDDEGIRYEKPKLKVVGLETRRSDIPSVSRDMIEKTLVVIMTGSQEKTQEFILKNKKKFEKHTPEEIAFSKTASQVRKYTDKNVIYRKGTPIHVRGALLYNYYLRKNELDNRYESIFDGDKVQYTYLKLPNPIKENVISFPAYLPDELDLKKYVDYDTQFNKSYVVPIQAILDVLGWTSEAKGTLEDFMK